MPKKRPKQLGNVLEYQRFVRNSLGSLKTGLKGHTEAIWPLELGRGTECISNTSRGTERKAVEHSFWAMPVLKLHSIRITSSKTAQRVLENCTARATCLYRVERSTMAFISGKGVLSKSTGARGTRIVHSRALRTQCTV